jgi:tripartite-type tricarboxylate transporter receptor subunit TctC
MVTNVYTFKALPTTAAKDFVPVRLVGRSPFVIAAAANFPAKDLAEVFAMAKAQPGTIGIATEGPKTFSGMLADCVAGLAGVKLITMPYTKPRCAQDVIGGRAAVCLPMRRSCVLKGQVAALAGQAGQPLVTCRRASLARRSRLRVPGWNGLFAPAGTPAEVDARETAMSMRC